MIKLSFMTFVCPTWDIERIVQFAKSAGYDGVEIRVDTGHRHGIDSTTDEKTRAHVRTMFADAGITIPCVATSCQFGTADKAERDTHIDKAKANIRLASDLGARVVRIFAGGKIPNLTDDAARYIAAAYDEVGEYAKALNVCPMLETRHDIILGADEGAQVIKRVTTENFGVLWNHSMIDDASFGLLKKHIRHFHIHDEVLETANDNMRQLAALMKSVDYNGFASLEIIKEKDLPEELLIETARRLKLQIAQA